MTDTHKHQNKDIEDNSEEIKNAEESSEESVSDGPSSDKTSEDIDELRTSVAEANDKYVRLYADFENYKKISARNKEELLKYANEEIMSDTLTVIDHLELALEHSSEDHAPSDSLAQGVELTLKELKTVLEKHGLTTIAAMGKLFDPEVHHAMSQIESDDADENTVIKEFRKGYKLRDRVLRAALVGVAVKPAQAEDSGSDSNQNEAVATDENSK
jgi:molecular chaperone GrpE